MSSFSFLVVKDFPQLGDYWGLLKPRVMSLVIFTSVCGYLLSPFSVHPFLAFVGILSIAIGAGASGCLNQWYEQKTDALMSRTKNRPIPSGRIDSDSALSFGVILSITSIILLQISFGLLQSFLLLFTILFYSLFYTIILKPNTPQNIVWGGISGALPPVIGYSLGGSIDVYAFCLFLIIFFWTPAHFWALSLNCKDDYANASIPIMPNIKGDQYTKNLIFVYAILTTLSTFLLIYLRESSILYISLLIILNTYWLYICYQLRRKGTNQKDNLKVFFYSMIYLFLIFLFTSIFH
ncbi:MAG: heme o synthase [Proteobacteria bacterium]|nr:heme o synthase [Pseudomonadota bacterium]